MPVTAYWYGLAFQSVFAKLMDLTNDNINVMLTTSTYTPNQDTHQYKSSVTNEVTGTGYTALGKTLASKVSTYTAATNVWNFDAADVTWATATITARYAVIYDGTPGTDATRPLLAYVDFGGDQSSAGGDFQIVWASSGILSVTVS